VNQRTTHDPEDLYEPFRQWSFPWLGIFGHVHPYPNFLVFGLCFISGVGGTGWGITLAFIDSPAALMPAAVGLFGMCPVGVWGLYTAFVRATWMRRYERITGAKPVFGDPANKPPGYDDRGWFAWAGALGITPWIVLQACRVKHRRHRRNTI